MEKKENSQSKNYISAGLIIAALVLTQAGMFFQLERIGARITRLDNRLNNRITELEQRMDRRFTETNDRITETNDRITRVEGRLDKLNQNFVDYLGKRLSAVSSIRDLAILDLDGKPFLDANGEARQKPLVKQGSVIEVVATGKAGGGSVTLLNAEGEKRGVTKALDAINPVNDVGDQAYSRSITLPASLANGVYTLSVSIAGATNNSLQIEVLND